MSRSAAHWSIFTPNCPNNGALCAGLRPLKLKWGIILKRIFLIVLDSMGVGAMPDAKDFGDEGASTIGSISKSKEFYAETLLRLGLGNIDGLAYLGAAAQPGAAVGRLAELSRGKDTTVGHWEIAGVVSPRPMPLYPTAFPRTSSTHLKRRRAGEFCATSPIPAQRSSRTMARSISEPARSSSTPPATAYSRLRPMRTLCRRNSCMSTAGLPAS